MDMSNVPTLLLLTLLGSCASSPPLPHPVSLYEAEADGHYFREIERRPAVSVVDSGSWPGTPPDAQALPFYWAHQVGNLATARGYSYVVVLGETDHPQAYSLIGFTNEADADIAAEFPSYYSVGVTYQIVSVAQLSGLFSTGNQPSNPPMQRIALRATADRQTR